MVVLGNIDLHLFWWTKSLPGSGLPTSSAPVVDLKKKKSTKGKPKKYPITLTIIRIHKNS